MQQVTKQTFAPTRMFDPMLKISLATMAGVLFAAFWFLVYIGGLLDSFSFLFLLPWIILLTAVLLAPVMYFASRGGQGFDSPLMLCTVSYFIPAFAVGGLSLAVGWSQPYYLDLINDVRTTLQFTILLIIIGYVGLAVGFFLPIGSKAGDLFGKILPEREHTASAYLLPGVILLSIGLLSSTYALIAGVIGFQRVDEVGIFDGLIFLSTLFPAQGSFILWWALFREGRLSTRSWIIVGFLIATAIFTALFAGNRGTLISMGIIVVMAYLLAGRKFTLRSSAITVGLLLLALLAGMIYGTAFRANKGSQSRAGIDEYAGTVGDTLTSIASGKNVENFELGLTSLAQRLDIVSSLAVVVSNHEQLAPYEEGYGLDNNIAKDTTYFFIPRAIWPEKPVASDSRAYSDLYFEYDENSFAITPIGDLLRNFGVPGVFLGMFLLGIALRFIYRSLVEGRTPNLLRSTLYIMLVITISYEGFYGTILPMLFKVGITAMIGLIIVELIATQTERFGRKSVPISRNVR